MAERFFAALAGDVADIAAVLAEDVVLHGDGGGKVPAIARPLVGVERVSRAFWGWATQSFAWDARIEIRMVNGQPGGVILTADGGIVGVIALDIADGRVREIRNVLNPDKLDHLGRVADVRALLRGERG